MTRRTFGLPTFGNEIRRDDIPCMGSSDKFQPITCVVIVLFYRHNKRDDHLAIDHTNRKTKTQPDTPYAPEWS